MPPDNTDALYAKVKGLNELLWENRATRPAVDQWLANFTGDCMPRETERKHALYLLSKFLYFGQNEVRELLRAMFQDLFRQPLSVKVRAGLTDRDDFDAIHRGFLDEVSGTRFLGLGNPAESGTHILYDFRLVNRLPLEAFASPHDLFSGGLNDPETKWAYPKVDRLVFIDDFCGTGNQGSDMGFKYLPLMREVAERCNIQLEIWYLTLVATTKGLAKLRACALFDRVECVSELDATYRIFDVESLVYIDPPEDLKRCDGETIARHYGECILPGNPLGYGNCQLLLGFHHNVPNNTLPIIWQGKLDSPWHAIFPRFTKYYS